MSELVRTGVQGLDEILRGGLRPKNVLLVEGPPGSGKSTLGQQFIHEGALAGEPGLIVSFEMTPERMMSDAMGFGWDFAGLEEKGLLRLVYTTPSVILEELQSSDGVLSEEVHRLGARRVLIDGISPLRAFGERTDGPSFRESLNLLMENLQRWGVVAMLTRESNDFAEAAPERFLCDAIIALGMHHDGDRTLRSLEVVKARGQPYVLGRHTLRITEGTGMQVFPRAASLPRLLDDQPTSNIRGSTGIAGLDELLGGGLYEGSLTLVAGISGSGKTVTSLQFLGEGVAKGEKGLLVSLDEHPRQLARNAASVGWDLEGWMERGEVSVLYESPLELEADVHFRRLADVLRTEQPKRVVIDSLAAYESATRPRSHEFVLALAGLLKEQLVMGWLNYETAELLGVSAISEDLRSSHLVDNLVLLNYVEISTVLRRAVTVPKARGSRNLSITREFSIGDGGITVLDEPLLGTGTLGAVPQLPFSSYYGLLARSPARRSPVVEEAVAEHASDTTTQNAAANEGE